jgi:hypothetical protein
MVEYVPGNLLTMMTHPRVRRLAQHLRAALFPRQGALKKISWLQVFSPRAIFANHKGSDAYHKALRPNLFAACRRE